MPSLSAPFALRSGLFALFLALLAGCNQGGGPPDLPEETYQEAVSGFYTGLVAMEVGQDQRAEAKLLGVTRLVPGEAAAWANLGLLALRQNNLTAAAERLAKARDLAPNNSRIQALSAMLAERQGSEDAALAYYQQAVALDSTNINAIYALAQTINQQRPDDTASLLPLFSLLGRQAPDNLAVLLEQVRLALRLGDRAAAEQAVARIGAYAGQWPDMARTQWEALRDAVPQEDTAQAVVQAALLRNVLLQVQAYRDGLAAIQSPPEKVADLLTTFTLLKPSPAIPSPPDDSLAFAAEPVLVGQAAWSWIGSLLQKGAGIPHIVVADAQTVQVQGGPALPFPGGSSEGPTPNGVAGIDLDNDFVMDIALAGEGGLRLFRQDTTGAYTDVTQATGLSKAVTEAAYAGVWAADLDMEGDVDLLLARTEAAPRILRNNGDGTFSERTFFAEAVGMKAFAWADFDGDGDPDAALIDGSGRLHLYQNGRSGRFDALTLPETPAPLTAVAAAELSGDAVIDLLLLDAAGGLTSLSLGQEDPETTRLATWEGYPGRGAARLFVIDLDNNGGLDLVASVGLEARVWLENAGAGFLPPHAVEAGIFSIATIQDDGRLDLLGFDAAGTPVRLAVLGTKAYHWKQVRPRAALALGDQRINSFALGGEVEIRAGLLFQKQPITSPILHFGLGTYNLADVVRITWPNGDVQAEFDLISDLTVQAQQRLKGSCPWLFTYDGEGLRFVTDFIWRSPLGLRINAVETAGIIATEDWVKIRGDQLQPRDGIYDIRITAELWETHFFDHVSLMVVDHPVGTEVFVDERFAIPPPAFKVHTTEPPAPVKRAVDDRGQDVTSIVAARDGRYLDTFGRGAYQGITRDHYVEIDLGVEAPADGPLWLIANGWVRPTDSSINVAIGQGTTARPDGLRLEVADGNGGWVVVRTGLGFPSGKHKTILIDLSGVFLSESDRRVRLSTNLEVYWDALQWARGLPEAALRTETLAPANVDLRYRGYSEVTEADRSSPELPTYDRLEGTGQLWRDLVGYYTRFGEVRELLEDVDDRYVIMNAGDEMAFTFPEQPPPPTGWVRDYVLVGDGWVKDGDYNTTHSLTVRPLPAHDMANYDISMMPLDQDPVYLRHPEDWQVYHTRYVTPERFREAMRLGSEKGEGRRGE